MGLTGNKASRGETCFHFSVMKGLLDEERHVGSILYNITHEKSTPPPPGARLNAGATATSFH